MARTCVSHLALDPIVAVVDGIDDGVGEAYEAWPDRLYLVGRDGRVVFRGGLGPDGFDPDALERAIVEELARPGER